MTPLVNLLVIGLLLVVVAALLVWALVSPIRGLARRTRSTAGAGRPEARPVETGGTDRDTVPDATAPRQRVVTRTNDDLRGAKATRSDAKESVPDDAFERFLRAGRDDDR